MAKVIPQIDSEINVVSSTSSVDSKNDSPKTPFSFKQFKACGPMSFTGEDGPSKMFQWFDAIEVTFRQSGCPENLHTVNATGVFQSRALDWWTAKRNRRGNNAAYGLVWEELKELMMKEFCPHHEVQKLENEFWNIKQVGGDNAGLTARFKQLSIICPSQVDTPEKAIKKYIRALPDCVVNFVQAVKPATIEETYQLAAEINDKRVLAGVFKTSTKSLNPATAIPGADDTALSQASKSTHQNHKRINSSKNNAVVTTPLNTQPCQIAAPNAPPSKRAYTRNHPLCPT
ncbi:putative retrotransposon gag domain-containing protein [Helianthus annuus]|nr:putative retrotransposon gag domain-containing protein [Helianthus annuus]